MNCSSLSLGRPTTSFNSLYLLHNRKLINPQGFKLPSPSHFTQSRSQNRSRNFAFPPNSFQFLLRHGSVGARSVSFSRLGVSSDGSEFDSSQEDTEALAPSFREFITSERIKVVAMLALALSLCNADRVVMSVAIVPLSLAHGWSRSFSGIVQVVFS